MKRNDLDLGFLGELQFYKKYSSNLNWLSQYNKYSYFDFKWKNKYIELKTRRFNKKDIDSMGGHLIEKHKIEWLKKNKNNYDGLICYTYYDGTYYYKFNKNESNKDIRIGIGGNFSRGDKPKTLCYINGDKLKLLNKNLTTPDICLL